MSKKVSVVIPIYKVEQELAKCVESVQRQTHRELDIILVDDGSPDACGKMCDEFAKNDSRIHVIHRENGGLSAARNTGIEWVMGNSDSEWITFIDSDDWVSAEYVSKLYAAAQQHDCAIATSAFLKIRGNEDLPTDVRSGVCVLIPEDAWCSYRPVTAWGKLYRKSLFSEVRFPEGKIHEDELTTYKVLFAVPRIAYVNKPLYAYMIRGGSIVGSDWSEGRLNTLDAIDQQVAYFRGHGFGKAYSYEMRHRATMTYNCVTNAKRCRTFPREKCKKLQLRLRNAIRDCRHECIDGFGVFSRIAINAWLPMFDWPFWIATTLIYRRR